MQNSSYISLEINKTSTSLEIYLGGTVLEDSEMKGGIALKINRLQKNQLIQHIDEQEYKKTEFIPEIIKKEKKLRGKREDSYYLSQDAIDAINAYRHDNELSVLEVMKIIGKACGKSYTTVRNSFMLNRPATTSIAAGISDVIGYKLKAQRDRNGVLSWTPVVTDIKQTHEECFLLSTSVVNAIKSFIEASNISKSELSEQFATKTGKSTVTFNNYITIKNKTPANAVRALSELTGLEIIAKPDSKGIVQWRLSNEVSDEQDIKNNNHKFLSSLARDTIHSYIESKLDEISPERFYHEIASKADISKSVVTKIINGETPVTDNFVKTINQTLGLELILKESEDSFQWTIS